jgi:hypothetical protein
MPVPSFQGGELAFPDLRGSGSAAVTLGAVAHPKRQMSAEARKAMSERMLKYWAKRKVGGK